MVARRHVLDVSGHGDGQVVLVDDLGVSSLKLESGAAGVGSNAAGRCDSWWGRKRLPRTGRGSHVEQLTINNKTNTISLFMVWYLLIWFGVGWESYTREPGRGSRSCPHGFPRTPARRYYGRKLRRTCRTARACSLTPLDFSSLRTEARLAFSRSAKFWASARVL